MDDQLTRDSGSIHVLLVEDTVTGDAWFRRYPGAGFDVHTAADLDSAKPALESMIRSGTPPQCVVVDLALGESEDEGISFIKDIHQKYPDIPIVIWTKHSGAIIKKGMEAGARVGRQKYIDDGDLRQVVLSVIGKTE